MKSIHLIAFLWLAAVMAPGLTHAQDAAQPAKDVETESAPATDDAEQSDASGRASTAASGAPSAVRAAAGPQLTRADLQAWLAGFMPYALKSGGIAGGVVVVVDDGEVLFMEGYGYADVSAEEPVDPRTTMFRVGSVSKLLTWTAVMQLVEAGKLDLDKDINAYLDFKIPKRYGAPITLRDLLFHRPGFEENIKELIASDPEQLDTLREALADWVPERIFPPGTTPAYSNYGAALAGYIVQRVSGQPFYEYVEEHIFEPLGMKYATFRQPLPEKFEPYMSEGYRIASGEPKPYELVGLAPAGSMAASGAAMAKFMIAHLQKGDYRGAEILEEETAVRMHTTAPDGIGPLSTMKLGFYETSVNGQRIISHGGDTQWFHSNLHLFLDEGVGLFISLNSSGKQGAAGDIRSALFRQFADRYFPAPETKGGVDAETAVKHARMIAGNYVNSRRPESNFLAALNLFGQIEVSAKPEGNITVSLLHDLSGELITWREIRPFVWREVGGERLLAAKVEDGEVVRWSVDPYSAFMVFEPVPWWMSGAWLVPALIAGFAALILSAVLWPVRAIARRHYGAGLPWSRREIWSYRLVRIAAIGVIAVLLGWAITIQMVFANLTAFTPALDPWWWTLQIAGLVIFIVAAIIALWNVWVVWTGQRSWLAKFWSLVLAAACLVVLWVAYAYELITMTVHY